MVLDKHRDRAGAEIFYRQAKNHCDFTKIQTFTQKLTTNHLYLQKCIFSVNVVHEYRNHAPAPSGPNLLVSLMSAAY